MKVSIVIPVYNTEKYLKQCIDSVKNQTYEDLEILLVDDGASDASPKICDDYAKQDVRIQVIHKQNGGLSDARNTGIKFSKGEYVLFLDSDDYWDDVYLIENLVDKLKRRPVDVLNFRYKKYLEIEKKMVSCLESLDEIEDNDKENILEKMIDHGLYIASACNKMIKLDFLKKNKLYFKKEITSEDIDWCARILIQCRTIGYCNSEAYVYRQRENSISHSLTYKNIYDLSNNIKECVELGKNIPKDSKFYELYYDFTAYQYGVLLLSNNMVNDVRIKEIMREMKQYQWLLKYHRIKKIKILYYVKSVVGYSNLTRCLKLYCKFKNY
ncbi:hypothetical protein BHF70_05950 [Anaerostipes sp. 494a]|uniref:glycosyltransferase family 2 protein n=1 Tax=Anaerostipes sp. 494a TaxID=1261636 RepID=UPI0009520B88|nr:glycosyltransferase family 2 protein [Anaerostipes sp. 494a]OLR59207.1 hypothetical protein BHF70_05950 [Anaerostipes sp. 494a]